MDINDLISHFRYLSVAAKTLRVSRATLYNWAETGIPYGAQLQIEHETGGKLKAVKGKRRKASERALT